MASDGGSKESGEGTYAGVEDVEPEVARRNAEVQSTSIAAPPTLGQVLLDPRRVPCFREAMLVGIVGGFFAGSSFGLIKGQMKRVPNFAVGGFVLASTFQWIVCRKQYSAKRALIRQAMSGEVDLTNPEIAKQIRLAAEAQGDDEN